MQAGASALELPLLGGEMTGRFAGSRVSAPLARKKHAKLEIGLADASLVVLGERYATRRILTFDERAFRTVRLRQGGRFTLLPTEVERQARVSVVSSAGGSNARKRIVHHPKLRPGIEHSLRKPRRMLLSAARSLGPERQTWRQVEVTFEWMARNLLLAPSR